MVHVNIALARILDLHVHHWFILSSISVMWEIPPEGLTTLIVLMSTLVFIMIATVVVSDRRANIRKDHKVEEFEPKKDPVPAVIVGQQSYLSIEEQPN